MNNTSATQKKKQSILPYILPFVLFALFTYFGPIFSLSPGLVYPINTIAVAGCLAWFWRIFKSEFKFQINWSTIVVGIVVFLIWIGLEGLYPQIGTSTLAESSEYNVYGNASFLAVRLTGAVLVVPIMEELFWRSFALRFLINTDFTRVPIGKFTWFSFITVALAFGFEHHRWLPGIIAGVAYAGLLYRSKNLFSPTLSHAVTNLLLGIYVITTQRWEFW